MQRTLLAFLLVFAFLGVADSWYLAQSALTNTPLSCDINGLSGCNAVAQSAYAHLFGIPLGVYGVVFYALIFILTAFLAIRKSRLGFFGLTVLSWIGVLASVAFMWVQFYLIKELCVYCVGSAVISVLVGVTATWLWKRFAPLNVVSIPSIPLPPEA